MRSFFLSINVVSKLAQRLNFHMSKIYNIERQFLMHIFRSYSPFSVH